MFWTILVVLLVLALLGSPGFGPIQHGYGWGPSGLGFIVVVVLLVLLLSGRL